jgi:hypothetical protein
MALATSHCYLGPHHTGSRRKFLSKPDFASIDTLTASKRGRRRGAPHFGGALMMRRLPWITLSAKRFQFSVSARVTSTS